MKKRIFLSPPYMGELEQQFVRDAFDSNFIAPVDPQVDAFEKAFSEYTGIRHCGAGCQRPWYPLKGPALLSLLGGSIG